MWNFKRDILRIDDGTTPISNYFTLNYASGCTLACTVPYASYAITTTCAAGSDAQYTITGATAGDNIEVTATYSGQFVAVSYGPYGLSTVISSHSGTDVTGSTVSSTCYPHGSSSTWSISVTNKTYIHFTSTSKVITIGAVAQNFSSAYGQNVNLYISKINGVSTNVGNLNSGCYYNSGGAGCVA